MEHQRHPADRRVRRQAEQFLHADGENRAALGLVVDRDARAGRHLDMGRRLRVEAGAERPGQEPLQRLAEVGRGDGVEAQAADQGGREPILDGVRERIVRKVGPFRTVRGAKERDAGAPLRQRRGPGQPFEAEAGDPAREDPGGFQVQRDGKRALAKGDGAEPAQAARSQGTGRPVEGHLRDALDPVRESRFDRIEVDRGGGEDAGVAGGADDVGHHQEGLAGERRGGVEPSGAPVGHHELAVAPARLRDAVGIGQRQERSDARLGAPASPRGRSRRRRPRPALRHPAHVGRTLSAVATIAVDALGEVDGIAAEAALDQDGREIGGGLGRAQARGRDDHAREPRRQGKGAQAASGLGKAPVRPDRGEVAQHRAGLVQGRRGRRIQEGQRAGIGDAPFGAIEHQPGQVRRDDLGAGEGLERAGPGLGPEPPAHARLGPARPTPALVHGGPGGAGGHEPGQPEAGLVDRHPRETGIDHDAHALDGQRGLGDAGGEHDLAGAERGRRHRPVLLGRRQGAVERGDRGLGSDAPLQRRGDPADLALSRQKGQDGARIGPQGAQDRIGHRVLDPSVRIALGVAGLDREGAPFRCDDRCAAQQVRDAGAVQGRRHHQDAQVLAQAGLRVERQGQAEIGVEGAFVELVEQHGADAGEFRIVEDHAAEDALRHDLDPGAARDLGAEADAQADGVADALAERAGHALGRGPSGEAARLQQDDLAAPEPRRVEKIEGHPRRLACAGRRDQDGGVAGRQGRTQGGKRGIDRQGVENGANGHHRGRFRNSVIGASRRRHEAGS